MAGGPGVVLEMTDPGRLVEVPRPHRLVLRDIEPAGGTELGALYRRIWAPLGGGGRDAWDDERWCSELGRDGIRGWLAGIDGEDVGMAELGWSGDGNAAFVVVGIVPEHQGRGLGGELVGRLTRLMWETPSANGRRTDRVWVWTRPDEHPATVANYLARGFSFASA